MEDPTRLERAEMFCDTYLQSVYKQQRLITLEDIGDDESLYIILAANSRAAFGAGVLATLRSPEEIRSQIEGLGYIV